MKKWINGYLYPCKKIGQYPQIYVERSMLGQYKGIDISFFEVTGQSGHKIQLTTRMARMLVKRILQSLEEKR